MNETLKIWTLSIICISASYTKSLVWGLYIKGMK